MKTNVKKNVKFSSRCLVHRMLTKQEYDRTATKKLSRKKLKEQLEAEWDDYLTNRINRRRHRLRNQKIRNLRFRKKKYKKSI
jgi:hypothetical protein